MMMESATDARSGTEPWAGDRDSTQQPGSMLNVGHDSISTIFDNTAVTSMIIV